MKKIIPISIYLLCIHLTANAQVTQEWVAIYNDTTAGSNSTANAITVDGAGNVYVTGTSGDFVTIKYNSSGVQQWIARYNGGAEDAATAIAVDGSGNVYVTGYSSTGLHYAYATIKYDSSGVQQWTKTYTFNINDDQKTVAIAVDALGNVYITGTSYGTVSTLMDYATIKYNSAGVQQWVQRYDGPVSGNDYATAMVLDNSANVYVTGYSPGNGTQTDYATIKYDSSGVQQWVARYNGPASSYDVASSIALNDSGNVYVTGYSMSGPSFGTEDYATVKYNSSGVQQWASIYNGPGNWNDEAYSIAVDGSGNVCVTGVSLQDYATVKYNSSGVQQWAQRYNGTANSADIANKLVIDGSASVYVTGYSLDGNPLQPGYTTIKYNTSGNQQWLQRFNRTLTSWDYANAIAVDSSENVYVTGKSSNGTTYDYATIKYVQTPTSVEPLLIQVVNEFSISQNYPNPFNPNTTISYQVSFSGPVTIKVYDVLGDEVATLINEEQPAGRYEINFNATGLASGIYFYKINTGSFLSTKKMNLIK